MELRHLRYFVSVAEELHFARAAARIGIEQSPLSRAIRELEAELGVSLFRRTSRRTQMTPAGERLLQDARRILREVREIRHRARAVATGRTEAARIGLAPSIAEATLATPRTPAERGSASALLAPRRAGHSPGGGPAE